MKLLLFFVDGLGLGQNDERNPARDLLRDLVDLPFVASSAPKNFEQGILRAVDATGGVPGTPQSATGQASLMTGVNAPGLLGYHLTALPDQTLVDLVESQGLMKHLAEKGVSVTASNLYTPEYFERREQLAKQRGRNMLPVSALTIRSSGTAFRLPSDYEEGRALFTDLSNRFLQERGYGIPLITPEEAAERMVRILEESDFVFHEYFATDTYAHKRRSADLERALDEINRFLKTLRNSSDPQEVAILLISDHGNCEDADSADHNRNPVPLLLLTTNEEARQAFSGITELHQIKSGISAFFGLEPEDDLPESTSSWL